MKKHALLPTLVALVALIGASVSLGAQERGLYVRANGIGIENSDVGKQYAVFIAIDRYRYWDPLKNPVRDARSLIEVLTSRYYVDDVITLYNEDATKERILQLFDHLAKSLRTEDSLMVYYAGHGFYNDQTQMGFWIPVDGGTDNYRQDNWLDNAQLKGIFRGIKAKHILLLSDSCFSGDILTASRGARPEITNEYFKKAYQPFSRQVLTSGSSETVPDTSEFAEQLTLTLRGNNEPYLDPLMIFTQIRGAITATTPLMGELKDAGSQAGGSYLFFLRDAPVNAQSPTATSFVPSAAKVGGFGQLDVSATVGDALEQGAEIKIDGEAVGKTSPSLLVQDVAAGKRLKIEASKGEYYGYVEIVAKPDEIQEVKIAMELLKGNMVLNSSETGVTVYLDGVAQGPFKRIFNGITGGRHLLELKGEGLYYSTEVYIQGNKAASVSAKPYAVGNLACKAPANAVITIAGPSIAPMTVWGTATLENLPVGRYSAKCADLGYGTVSQEIEISKARTAMFQVDAPASIVVEGLPPGCARIFVNGATYSTAGRDSYVVANLRPGVAYSVAFEGEYFLGGERTELAITPAPGAAVSLKSPAGKLEFPWLPEGAAAKLNNVTIALSDDRRSSVDLVPGSYKLELDLPGFGTCSEDVAIRTGESVFCSSAVPFAISGLTNRKESERTVLAKRKRGIAFGWTTLIASGAGAAVGAVSYLLGDAAYKAYAAAQDSDEAAEARDKTKLFSSLFIGGALVGGAGLLVAPLAFKGPKPSALQQSIDDLDAQIQGLQSYLK